MLDRAGIIRTLDDALIVPLVNRCDRCQAVAIIVKGDLYNLRNCAARIVAVNRHDAELGRCGHSCGGIGAGQFNGNDYVKFLSGILLKRKNRFRHSVTFKVHARLRRHVVGGHFLDCVFVVRRDRTHQERAATRHVICNLVDIDPANTASSFDFVHQRADSILRQTAAAGRKHGAATDKVFNLLSVGKFHCSHLYISFNVAFIITDVFFQNLVIL